MRNEVKEKRTTGAGLHHPRFVKLKGLNSVHLRENSEATGFKG
jgi:hypothetical protein